MPRDIFARFARYQPFIHKSRNLVGVGFFAFEGTRPDHRHSPTRILKSFDMPLVPGDVLIELLVPEIHVGSGCRGRLAAVSMPETPMYEQHRFEPRKNDIRRSRQSRVVKSISKPHSVQRSSKLYLRTGVFLADLGHDSRTCVQIDGIHYSTLSNFSMTFVEIRASRCR